MTEKKAEGKKDSKNAPKEESKKKFGEKEVPRAKKVEANIKGIKRIAGKDVSGDYKLSKALLKVRGIGTTLNRVVSKIISKKLGIPANTQVGDLSDQQIEEVDKIVMSLHNQGIFEYMLNRRKDNSDGGTKHVIMNDLIFANKQDIDLDKNIYSWRGYRHAYGQKVRGQKTRNTGRVGMTVGVLRKAILAQAKTATPATGGAGASAAKQAEKK